MPNGTTGIHQNKFGRGDEEKQKYSCWESSSPCRLLDNYLSRLTGPLIIVNQNNNNNNNEAISKNYFKNKILKEEIEIKCRLCKQHEETIGHLTSGCPILAKYEYLMRHDKVCTHLHYTICKALGTETTTNGTNTCPSQCMKREMSQCCGIKQYTQTVKLQQIGQI
jgi:hypothetical protein